MVSDKPTDQQAVYGKLVSAGLPAVVADLADGKVDENRLPTNHLQQHRPSYTGPDVGRNLQQRLKPVLEFVKYVHVRSKPSTLVGLDPRPHPVCVAGQVSRLVAECPHHFGQPSWPLDLTTVAIHLKRRTGHH